MSNGQAPLPFFGDDDDLGRLALPPIVDERSLVEARDWLAENIVEGAVCPCCDRHAQVYKWSMYATAAKVLTRLFRRGGTAEYVHINDVKRKGQGDGSRLRFFGLAVEEPDRRPDGGKSGWWCATRQGEAYLRGGTIPGHVHVYNKRVLATGGEPRTVKDALGLEFNFDDMMDGRFGDD